VDTETTPVEVVPDSIDRLVQSWELSLRARNRSARTVEPYTDSLRQFSAFLVTAGMPTRVGSIKREHIEAYLVDVREGRAFDAISWATSQLPGLAA
jgi:site-specific recombinase XerD